MSAALISSVSRWPAYLALLLAMVACGRELTPAASPTGGSGTSVASSPSPEGLSMATVTLTDEGCVLDAPSQNDAGPLRLETVNETGGQFDVDLWRIEDGHSVEEFDAHVAEEMRRIRAGEALLGHPAFASLIAESSAAARSAGVLEAVVVEGTYAIACIAFSSSGDLLAMWGVGPLEMR